MTEALFLAFVVGLYLALSVANDRLRATRPLADSATRLGRRVR